MIHLPERRICLLLNPHLMADWWLAIDFKGRGGSKKIKYITFYNYT
jgi:hypothetical protein